MDSLLTLVGNLTADPALGRTPAGTSVCRFRIAANERVFDRVAGQWRDGSVLYLPVICWRRLAENVAASLRRGDPVAVVGRLRQWRDDQQGALTTEVVAEVVGADLTRRMVRLLPPRPKDGDRDSRRGSGPAPPHVAADGDAAHPPEAGDGGAIPAAAAAAVDGDRRPPSAAGGGDPAAGGGDAPPPLAAGGGDAAPPAESHGRPEGDSDGSRTGTGSGTGGWVATAEESTAA